LAGGPVPPVKNARILELGCGDGVNLISLVAHIPGVKALGIDGSSEAIDTANEIVRATGLNSVRFEVADLRDLEVNETYDYVLAHGVYSWVQADVRDALMRIVSSALTPNGLAYISYNVTPGWHLRQVVRDAMLFATEGSESPQEEVRDAALFARDLAHRLPKSVQHGRIFQTYAESVALDDAPLVFHDYLAPDNAPIAFSAFQSHCEQYGLSWLMESAASDIRHPSLTDELRAFIESQDSWVKKETFIDHAYGRDFRRSIIVRTESFPETRTPPEDTLSALHAGLRAPAPDTIDIREGKPMELPAGRSETVLSKARTKGLVALLGACYPATRPVAELSLLVNEVVRGYAAEEISHADIAADLLTLAEAEAIDLISEPRYEPSPDENFPQTYRLAAHELRRGREQLTNRLHMSVSLDDLDRLVLLLCDGRPRQAIIERAATAVMNDEIPLLDKDTRNQAPDQLTEKLTRLVDARIDRLGTVGLLEDITTSSEKDLE
jgi:SAM-dependent methyltransferase